ncbi:MAG: SAM-dependent methyltransferase [Bacteroidota bacterium]
MIDRLLQKDVQEFIRHNAEADLSKLALTAKAGPDFPLKEALLQIDLNKKARNKLPEWSKHKAIIYPSKLSLEQCSSELAAKYKQNLISGVSLVDLTGGLGVDSYYLSEKFESVRYVEENADLVAAAKHNFRELGADHISCSQGEAEKVLQEIKEPIDYFYIDPARRSKGQKTYFLKDTFPNVVDLQGLMLDEANGYLLKTSPMLDIKLALSELVNVAEIHVVAINGECKELLFRSTSYPTDEPLITASNWQGGVWQKLQFTYSKEASTKSNISPPAKYLYEPNAAIIKAGALKVVADKYQLGKLHVNSHLYSGDERLNDFPGRAFQITATLKADKKSIKKGLGTDKANLTVRNFPGSVDQLRKKWGLKEGGQHYLFATTLADDRKVVLVCDKLSQQ